MICRDRLLTSVEALHRALSAYAMCVCEEASEEEKQMMLEYGETLSLQLRNLRELIARVYGPEALPRHLAISLAESTEFKCLS